MPTKVKETKAATPAKNAATPKKAAKKAKKVVEEEIKVEDIKVEKTEVVETPAPKKTPKKKGKKAPKKAEPEEPKEEMEVEDVKEKEEGSKKSKRRRKKRKRTVKAEDTEAKENESPSKKTKTDLEVPSEKMQKETGEKIPKEEPKEEREVEDTKEKVEGGEKAKKKRKRKRKRKRSEKAEDIEAKENESPQKKKKNSNVPDEKLELEGELLDMHTKRKTDISERTLIIRPKKFKQEYTKQRPDMCKDALFYGIKFGKLCFVVYKSKAEAEKKLTKLKKNPEVNHAWQWKQQQINATVNPYTLFVEHLPEGTTEEELQKIFPTATTIRYDTDKHFVNLAFSTKEDAETVFRESENLKMKGVGIVVLFGKYGYSWEREPKKGIEKQLKLSTD